MLRPYFSRMDSAGLGSREGLLAVVECIAGLGSRLLILETLGLGSLFLCVGTVSVRFSVGFSLVVKDLVYAGDCFATADPASCILCLAAVLENGAGLVVAGLGSLDLNLFVPNVGIFFTSAAGLGSLERRPVFIEMLLENFFGSAGLGSLERCAAEGIVLAFVTLILGVAGLGSLDLPVNDFATTFLASTGLVSREVCVRTVGLGSLERALFWKKLLNVLDVCLLYSLTGTWFPFSLAVNLLAMVAA